MRFLYAIAPNPINAEANRGRAAGIGTAGGLGLVDEIDEHKNKEELLDLMRQQLEDDTYAINA